MPGTCSIVQLAGGQGQLGRGERLGQPPRGLRPDERDDVVVRLALCEHPGDGQVSHRGPAGVGDLARLFDQLGLDVVPPEPGQMRPGSAPPSDGFSCPTAARARAPLTR